MELSSWIHWWIHYTYISYSTYEVSKATCVMFHRCSLSGRLMWAWCSPDFIFHMQILWQSDSVKLRTWLHECDTAGFRMCEIPVKVWREVNIGLYFKPTDAFKWDFSCRSTALMLRSGLNSTASWLGLGKHNVLASNNLLLPLKVSPRSP